MKKLLVLLVLAVVGQVLVGCSGEDAGAATNATPAVAPQAPAGDKIDTAQPKAAVGPDGAPL